MKKSLKWHIKCFENHRSSYQRLFDEVQRRQKECNKKLDEVLEYERQINLAVDRGLESFDRDRLGKKRGKK